MQTQPVSLRRSAKDSGASELLILLLGGTAAHLKRRPDRPASNSVHANTLGPELLGQRLDVVHAQRGSYACSDVPNDAGTRLEVEQGCLYYPKCRVDVGLCGRVEVFARYVQDRSPRDHLESEYWCGRPPGSAELTSRATTVRNWEQQTYKLQRLTGHRPFTPAQRTGCVSGTSQNWGPPCRGATSRSNKQKRQAEHIEEG